MRNHANTIALWTAWTLGGAYFTACAMRWQRAISLIGVGGVMFIFGGFFLAQNLAKYA